MVPISEVYSYVCAWAALGPTHGLSARTATGPSTHYLHRCIREVWISRLDYLSKRHEMKGNSMMCYSFRQVRSVPLRVTTLARF